VFFPNFEQALLFLDFSLAPILRLLFVVDHVPFPTISNYNLMDLGISAVWTRTHWPPADSTGVIRGPLYGWECALSQALVFNIDAKVPIVPRRFSTLVRHSEMQAL
jgi:hypothetical protein